MIQQQYKISLKHLVSGPVFIKTLLFVSVTSIYQLNLEVKFTASTYTRSRNFW